MRAPWRNMIPGHEWTIEELDSVGQFGTFSTRRIATPTECQLLGLPCEPNYPWNPQFVFFHGEKTGIEKADELGLLKPFDAVTE